MILQLLIAIILGILLARHFFQPSNIHKNIILGFFANFLQHTFGYKVKDMMQAWKLFNIALWFITIIIFLSAAIFIGNGKYFWMNFIYILVLILIVLTDIISLISYLLYGGIARHVMPNLDVQNARPYRDLTKEEKLEIHKLSKKEANSLLTILYNVGKKSYFYTITIWALWVLSRIIYFHHVGYLDYLLLVVLFIAISLVTYVVSGRVDNFYSDIKSPVNLISGVIVLAFEDENNRTYDYRVGKYGFFIDKTVSRYRNTAKNLSQGDNIIIEFSPHTHYVWKITKMDKL